MRRALVAACVLAVAGCGSNGVPATTPEVTSVPPSINKTYIAQAQKDGAKTVTLMVSVKEGQQEAVEQALRELGAAVEAQDPRIGYIKAEVPIGKVDAVPNLPGVSKVDVDEPINNRLPEP